MNEEIILNVETGSPYYYGCKAYVTQNVDGCTITIIDKDGTTTASVTDGADGNGISSVTLNADYTLTINYTDGTSSTTTSIRGEKGDSGVYVGTSAPSDPNYDVWIDTTGDPFPIDDEIERQVTNWLNEHPEATTTVTDGAVTTPKLAASAVTTAKIADGAVTNAKIANGAINNAKLASGAVDTPNIIDGKVTRSKLESAVVNDISTLQEDVSGLQTEVATYLQSVGSPLVASTAAGMTDHEKIYVYTGSEAGYTNGNWYYWNGSAWASGGVYNSTALNTDTTLLASGAAADSKTVGDKITDLKDDITQKETVINRELGYIFPEFEYGNISSGGESNTNKVVRTGYIPFTTGQKIKITFPNYFTLVRVLLYKEANYNAGSYITLFAATSGQTYQLNNAGLNYIRIRGVANDQVIDLDRTYEIIPQIVGTGDVEVRLDTLESDDAIAKDDIVVLARDKEALSYTVSTDLIQGYVENTDGTFGNLNTYKRTNLLSIPKSTTRITHTFPFSSSGTDGWAVYDKNKTYITGGRTSWLNVKENYAYFAISCKVADVVDDTVTLTYEDMNLNNRNYNIVMMGDSIVGNFNSLDSIPAFLSSYSKATCYNCAFGGTTMGSDTVAPIVAIREAFNGWKLINAIVNNDYTDQLAAIADDPDHDYALSYFTDHITTMQNMDWSKVDVITFSYGTNDWGLRVVLEDNTLNPDDTGTFGGAFRTALKTLWATYPHIKVVLFSPIWRGIVTTPGTLDEETNTSKCGRQYYLWQYADKLEEIANEFNVPYFDVYHTLNFNEHTWKTYFPLNDATHPNAVGRKAIAKKYAESIIGI